MGCVNDLTFDPQVISFCQVIAVIVGKFNWNSFLEPGNPRLVSGPGFELTVKCH